MGLQIYNTLSGKKEAFAPLTAGEVRMYVCGMTVYNSSHVGHARFLLTFDVIFRYLEFLGYRVTFVRNFTDVDDKIIQRAAEQRTTAKAIAERYIDEFRRDSAALGLVRPTVEPRATEHMVEIISLIRRLEEKGVVYRVNGDVYFSVKAFPEYGKLSHKELKELEPGARVEIDTRKKDPADFALWKASKEGEPYWESPWGRGRPGWHIECSAMSTKYLGQPFDIHGGGTDLIFPHHENEIAQSEAAFDRAFARYWIHNELLQIDRKKMSKSLGNVYTIQEIINRYEPVALRYYFLSSHYRSLIEFSEEELEEALKALGRIYETLDRVEGATGETASADPSLLDEFRREMDDDFNTPRALALMHEEVRSLNRLLDEGKTEGMASRRAALNRIGNTLGIIEGGTEAFLIRKKERWLSRIGLSESDVEDLIRKREQARREKNWAEADQIRSHLRDRGIALEDSPGGTLWKVQ